MFTRSTSRWRILSVAVVTALTLTACGGGSSAGSKDEIVVAMGHEAPYPGEEAVMYAIPKGLGLFKKLGIDVKYQTTAGSAVAAQLVQAGKADVGHGNPSAVFAAIDNGAKFKVVYNVIPSYGSGLAVLPANSIKSPKDLKGKTVGVASLSSSRLPEAKQMVAEAGLTPDKDVQFVAVGVGAQAASALTSKKVDGLFLWDGAYQAIQVSGTKLRVIKNVFNDSKDLLDYVQYANEDTIKAKGDALAKLGKAAAIAQEWAIKHPAEALELFYKEYPNAKVNNEQDRARDLKTLEFTLKQFDPQGTTQTKWGETPAAKTEATAKFLKAGKQIKKKLPADAYVDNQFVDDYNDYTDKDVQEAAPTN